MSPRVPRLLPVLWMTAATLAGAAQAQTRTDSERPLHRFLEVDISPDGAHVADIEGSVPPGSRYPDVRELIIRQSAGAGATRIVLPCGRAPECWPGSLAWTPDGKRLSFALRSPGTHEYSLYSVAADGGGLHRLLAFKGTLTDLKYAPDGTLAVLAVENARKEVGATESGAAVAGDLGAPPPEQRIATVQAGSLHFESPPELFVYEYDWRPKGAGFIGTAAPGDGDQNWWTAKLYAFAQGHGRVIYTPASIRQQLAAPTVSPDGRTVAFIAGLMSDFGPTGGDVDSLALDTGAVVDLTPGIEASAREVHWSCDGALHAQLLAGDRLQIVDLGAGRAVVAPRVLWSGAETVEGRHTSVSCPSGARAVVHESFTAPPEIEVGATGRWHDLTHANAGLTLPARVESIAWKNEGFTQQGWLLLPPAHAEGRMPLVTIVHGGPAGAAVPYFQGPGLDSSLLGRGWAVFLPNPRGSFGQGERFTLANVRDFGYGDLRDILAGIDAVERAAPIDPARLGIMGGSYGGFMTMWAVTQTTRFKAAVAAAGVSDWQSYYGENGIDEWLMPYFGASLYDDPEVYARSSPIRFIRRVRTPTFVYVGERDIECPAPQTQEFWHALHELKVPTAIMIYPNEGHGLRQPAHAKDALDRTLAWFDQYLR
jgi:dipeptidyl aminopeptidase/acylaminoacyl peptidase